MPATMGTVWFLLAADGGCVGIDIAAVGAGEERLNDGTAIAPWPVSTTLSSRQLRRGISWLRRPIGKRMVTWSYLSLQWYKNEIFEIR
jgi:hypothetical protein